MWCIVCLNDSHTSGVVMHYNVQMYAGSRITNAETRRNGIQLISVLNAFLYSDQCLFFLLEYYVMCRYRPFKGKISCNLLFAVSTSNLWRADDNKWLVIMMGRGEVRRHIYFVYCSQLLDTWYLLKADVLVFCSVYRMLKWFPNIRSCDALQCSNVCWIANF